MTAAELWGWALEGVGLHTFATKDGGPVRTVVLVQPGQEHPLVGCVHITAVGLHVSFAFCCVGCDAWQYEDL